MEAYEFSIPMALADFVPVALFAISMVLMQRDMYNKMPKYSFACFAAGTIDVMLAGFMKALWKMLYAAGVCDFHVLNTILLPMQSLGFLLAGLGIVLMLTNRKTVTMAVAVPAVFKGTVIFISMMVLGLGTICTCLSILAVKLKKKALIPVFILCFFCYMSMGYLASREVNSSAMNWIEQGVNTLGQVLLLVGVASLHRAGLRDFKLI